MKIKITLLPKNSLLETDSYAFGGDLLTHGANFDDGFTYIGNGGTHELNPNEGVLIGIAPDGKPNLVEEGEIVWNDYVFSDRLKHPKTGKSFAKEALKASKESEERPNDPISKHGQEAALLKLTLELERIRQKNMIENNYKKKGKSFDNGGWSTTARIIGGLGPLFGLAHDLANPADYTNAEKIETAARNIGNIGIVKPITTLTQRVKPLVYDPYLEEAMASAEYNAAVNKVLDLSGGNRAAANAQLQALNYNRQNAIGARARLNQKDIFSAGLLQQLFNRETDKYNIDNQLKADILNQSANQYAEYQRALLLSNAAQFRENIRLNRLNSIALNASQLFSNIGSMGEELQSKDMIKSLAESGIFGELNDAMKEKLGIKANGGRVRFKNNNKKGLTF